MKFIRHLFAAVFATAFFGFVGATTGFAGCEENSISPTVYTYYGTRETITQRIDEEKVSLDNRRVFVQITQGNDSAEVKLFEKGKSGKYDVSVWHGKSLGDLYARLNAVIVSNKGINCVGEQVKAAIKESLRNVKVQEDVAAPASAFAAFAHSVKEANGDFLMTAIYILC